MLVTWLSPIHGDHPGWMEQRSAAAALAGDVVNG